ncbi:MAG: hypothetical protein IGQ88_07700 [Gloeomargaritaceae cyanobacterium C42_A2020_066]|nr:hypothetical protein [Gloeomargaritaceae cyanobacterium C42_A2020_066]
MLAELQHLDVELNGRFTTSDELKFLGEYLTTVDLRLSAYAKISAADAEILDALDKRLLARFPKLYRKGTRDLAPTCRRDRFEVLRACAAAMLMDDPEGIKQRLLYWFETVLRAYHDEKEAGLSYQMLQDVLKDYLTPQEAALMKPILDQCVEVLGTLG